MDLLLYVCMFALNEGTATRVSPPLSVCKVLAVLKTDGQRKGLMIKFMISLENKQELFAICTS